MCEPLLGTAARRGYADRPGKGGKRATHAEKNSASRCEAIGISDARRFSDGAGRHA